MINKELFKEEIISLIRDLYDSQKDNINQMAELIADCVMHDGVIHIFASGHSISMGIELKDRIGSLVPIHIMDMNDFVSKGGVSLEEFTDKNNIFERREGMAERLYDLYDIRENDIFILVSNSGINGIVIDYAKLARDNGHKIIVITSMKHTLSEDSRHPSGKKLYEFGDVVVDNMGPHGDAFFETDGIIKVCSVSSITNDIIGEAAIIRAIEIMKDKGYEIPLVDENRTYYRHYEGRI